MSNLELYSQIPALAEATFLGTVDSQQKTMIDEIKQDDVLAHEYHDYVEFLLQLSNHGKRSRVKAMLASLKKEHRSRWHIFKTNLEKNKTIIEMLSRAAVFFLFAFAVYYLVESKVDNSQKQISALGKKVNQIDHNQKLNAAKVAARDKANYSGTAFAISEDGLFVTANHIVQGADSVYIFIDEDAAYKASVLSTDEDKDIAILKIADEDYDLKDRFPYAIKTSSAALSSDVYTLSFSKNDKVYNRGYVSSLTGYNGDTTFYQLYLPASEGSSGSPVLDASNNIIGFVSSKNTHESDVTYAVKMEYVQDLISSNEEIENNTIFKLNNRSRKVNIKDEITNLNNFVANVRVIKK